MPFAVNVVGQVLSCPSRSHKQTGEPTHIRWVVNDGVVPLTGIHGCKYSRDGMCEFDIFVSGMKQRIAEVDYDFACNGDYEWPDPNNIVDGQLPRSTRS